MGLARSPPPTDTAAPAVSLRRPDAEDRMQGCTHARLHRITRHDTIGHWLHGHVAARKKRAAVHEQKTWVSTPAPARSLPVPPDTRQAVDRPRAAQERRQLLWPDAGPRRPHRAHRPRHKRDCPRGAPRHLEYLGVDIPRFVAYAIFVIEYQHHKATADYMARASSGLKGKTAAAPDGRALS